MTNGWYAAFLIPWLLALLVGRCVEGDAGWGRSLIPVALAALYLAADLFGTFFLMVPEYTAHAPWPVAQARLGELHPWFFPSWAIVPLAAALGVVAAGATLRALLRSGCRSL